MAERGSQRTLAVAGTVAVAMGLAGVAMWWRHRKAAEEDNEAARHPEAAPQQESTPEIPPCDAIVERLMTSDERLVEQGFQDLTKIVGFSECQPPWGPSLGRPMPLL